MKKALLIATLIAPAYALAGQGSIGIGSASLLPQTDVDEASRVVAVDPKKISALIKNLKKQDIIAIENIGEITVEDIEKTSQTVTGVSETLGNVMLIPAENPEDSL